MQSATTINSNENSSAADDTIIEVITEGAAAGTGKKSNCFTYYPHLAPIVTAVLFRVLADIIQMVAQYESTGQFVQGALSTYSLGYINGLYASVNTTAQNYHIYQLNDNSYANPYKIEADVFANSDFSSFFQHQSLRDMTAMNIGLTMAMWLMNRIGENADSFNRNTCLKTILSIFITAFFIPYAVFGFNYVNDEGLDLNIGGEAAGISTYGYGDAINSLCPKMNYTGTCPSPTLYLDMLRNAIPAHPLTEAGDNGIWAALMLSIVLLSPLTSAALYGVKKIKDHITLLCCNSGERERLLPRSQGAQRNSSHAIN